MRKVANVSKDMMVLSIAFIAFESVVSALLLWQHQLLVGWRLAPPVTIIDSPDGHYIYQHLIEAVAGLWGLNAGALIGGICILILWYRLSERKFHFLSWVHLLVVIPLVSVVVFQIA